MNKLKRYILLAILAGNGEPLPISALISAVEIMARPAEPTRAEILNAIKQVQTDGYVDGASDPDELRETEYLLTSKGILRARQL